MSKYFLPLLIILAACGGVPEPAADAPDGGAPLPDAAASTDADVVADAQASADAQAAADAQPVASCAGHPVCDAFHNTGSFGGHVSVTLSADSTEAIVVTNSLPDYEPGPFGRNPNMAEPQTFTFRIPLVPVAGPSPAGLGHVAVAWNGVSMFNPSDARRIGGCTGNAAYIEADSVDQYGGHPTMNGEYHYHTGELLKHADALGLERHANGHSPLVGYAFDGIPIYGPYGFSSPTDAASSVREMRSCYRLKAARTCCTDANVCSLTSMFQLKPLIMGAFVEDYELDPAAMADGRCDLDAYNSRVAITPEYPAGTRIYVMTFDADGTVAFPFIFGTQYWGATLNQ